MKILNSYGVEIEQLRRSSLIVLKLFDILLIIFDSYGKRTMQREQRNTICIFFLPQLL